ncbi:MULTISPECIES: hypothetical protein [Vibrio]|uniref:Ubiquitin-like domain-containing protein n=2 Tax=Vibrio TaxID=662 RepID=A0A177XW52_9VIBR|nr:MULTISPECIES: hypothetical protein [Vibrio]EIV8608431.1 hypothetical protein [Vibrio vulnificus]EJB1759931.1 hypothetical protein [Vibrio parahaemolyticus]EKL0189133.1 hypothetical protein [Vibrio parahaemolyticus]ELR8673561.1 hypothetical protein [Vibrio vulnificus]ELR8760581.1 hypothetical protein [Vibrio vulnificus]
MSEVKVIIRTADQTRKAEVVLDLSNTGADVIQASVDNWSLPVDTDYSLVSTNSGKTLTPSSTLSSAEIKDGDILEVQPVLVAG